MGKQTQYNLLAAICILLAGGLAATGSHAAEWMPFLALGGTLTGRGGSS